MKLDLSLNNFTLYEGISIAKVGGRLVIDLSDEVLNKIGENIEKWLQTQEDRSEIILTGAAPIPVYLIAFHLVVHRFRKVRYTNEMYDLLISRH